MDIGFVGTGVMGSAMARRLMDAGHHLRVHNRTPERAAPLLAAGATWADSPAAAARGADVVVSIVARPEDVHAVHLGPPVAAGDAGGDGNADGGVVGAARPGALLIDMTTSRPSLAVEIHAAAAARGIGALDAPVSGGDVGARDGTLSIMVGGDDADFQRAAPILGVLGRTIVHQGPAGAGQHTKLANQVAIASTMIGVAETLIYVRRAGLDPLAVLESIGAGAAGSWSLSNLYPRAARGDFAPGFAVRHFLKDLAMVRDEAAERGLVLPGMSLAIALYERLAAAGGADLGTQALARVLEEVATGR